MVGWYLHARPWVRVPCSGQLSVTNFHFHFLWGTMPLGELREVELPNGGVLLLCAEHSLASCHRCCLDFVEVNEVARAKDSVAAPSPVMVMEGEDRVPDLEHHHLGTGRLAVEVQAKQHALKEHEVRGKLVERHRQREKDKQDGSNLKRAHPPDSASDAGTAGPAVVRGSSSSAREAEASASKRPKAEGGPRSTEAHARTPNQPELRELLIKRVVQQENAIVATERETRATMGTASERHSKDRTNAYDAILRAHHTEMNSLREKLEKSYSARLEEQDCSAVPLDPAAHQIIDELKRKIQDAEARRSEAHKKVLALPFDPENTGRLVVNRQRSLRAENKELERQAITGRHGQLKCEIALYRRHNADIKTELQHIEAYSEQLDTEITTMQTQIVALRAADEDGEAPSGDTPPKSIPTSTGTPATGTPPTTVDTSAMVVEPTST
eukprot:m.25349 g.25349  ORF g.25349 m.25349 type:complete len:441 (+) comp11481_c0_seq2:129-1451(+)